MASNPVEIELLENGDYHIKLNHQLLANIEVQLSKVPEENRGGVARALLSASALYCMAGTLADMLNARSVPIRGMTGSASVRIGKNVKGREVVGSLNINLDVDVPEENLQELDRCIKILDDGCFITGGLKKGLLVNNHIRRVISS
jgi:hypothetical protein